MCQKLTPNPIAASGATILTLILTATQNLNPISTVASVSVA
jgi:hypothetical protein